MVIFIGSKNGRTVKKTEERENMRRNGRKWRKIEERKYLYHPT